jgi:hypothetical protein
VLGAWLACGSYEASTQISIMDGSSDFARWFGSVNLTGQCLYEDYRFRPKLALFYAHDDVDDPEYRLGSIPELEGYTLSMPTEGTR